MILLAGVIACDSKGNVSGESAASTGDVSTGDEGTSGAPGTADPPGHSTTSGEPGTASGGEPMPNVPTTEATEDVPDEGLTTGWIPPDSTSDPTTETDGGGYTTADETTGEPVEPCVGEPVPIDAEMIAYLDSQIAQGPGPDPSLLYVRFASQSFTCADPHAKLSCGGNWELSLRIPEPFQAPGLYSLSLDDVHAFGMSNGIDLGGDDCDGGGSVAQGTVEILSIDADKVVGRLCHVTWSGLDGELGLDGSFVAPRCPQ